MIYLVAPNAVRPSGGVGVAAQWVRLLIEHGHEAMFITPNGDPSPYWINFTVPAGSYADIKDEPGNKRVDVWMDCMMEFRTHHMDHYFFAQDVFQLEHIAKEKGLAQASRYRDHLYENCKLITIGPHSQYYYAYRMGLVSSMVPNFIDPAVFHAGAPKIPKSVCMIDHRDHFSTEIAQKLIDKGFTLKIASGNQTQVAQTMRECVYFFSAATGRPDGVGFMCEGFPTPILEAMASGCVPLCRNTHGTNTFIIHNLNGFYWTDETMDLWIDLMWTWNQPNIQVTAMMAHNTAHQCFNRNLAWTQIQEALELK